MVSGGNDVTLTYHNVVDELCALVPGLAVGAPYAVFGDLSLRIRAAHHAGDAEFLTRTAGFLHRMVAADDPDLISLVQVGVLECVLEDQATTRAFREYLDPSVRVLFDDVEEFWSGAVGTRS